MLRKSITAVVIAAFEMMITLDQWNGVSKIITAAVVFWGMNLFLLLGMEKEEKGELSWGKSMKPFAKSAKRMKKSV